MRSREIGESKRGRDKGGTYLPPPLRDARIVLCKHLLRPPLPCPPLLLVALLLRVLSLASLAIFFLLARVRAGDL